MRTWRQRCLREKLELIHQPPAIHKTMLCRLRARIMDFQTCLYNWFKCDRTPIVREVINRQGISHYRVYDPVGDRTLTFDSHHDVMDWLESRHQCNHFNPWDDSV